VLSTCVVIYLETPGYGWNHTSEPHVMMYAGEINYGKDNGVLLLKDFFF